MPADFEISPLIPESKPTPPPANPTPPPMAPPHRVQIESHRVLKWLLIAGAVLFVLAIGSIWWGGNSFSDRNVIVTVTVPDRAISGDQVTFHVSWRNETRVALTDLRFRLFYPAGTIVTNEDGTPETPESIAFVVDRVAPGASVSRDFQAYLVGDKGEIKTARLNLIFQAGSLRSSFQKDVTATTTITDLPVSLTLVAPPTAVPGQAIQYLLDVRNDTAEDLYGLKVQFTYPDGFTPQRFTPQPDTGNRIWEIDTLRAGQGTRIRVDGTLAGSPQETKNVVVALQRQLNGQFVDYVRTNSFTMLSSPLLSVSIQPDAGRDYVAFPGDRLRYVVTYRNSSQYTLLGATLNVKLEGDMYDLANLQVQQGFFDESARTVRFDASGVPDLGALSPGRSGQVSFTVPLKTGITGQLGGAKTIFVKATAMLGTINVPTGVDASEVMTSDSLVTKIGSQPTLTAGALYDGGAGSGPMPPQVGQTTTVMIRWQAVNPGNDVKETKVTATLAPGASWADSAVAVNGGSAPTFDAARNTITWTIGTLPFGTGNGTARYEATFKVSITPSSNQVGQLVPLIGTSTLTGTDSFTSQGVQATARDLNTGAIENHSNDSRVVQ